MAYDQINPNGRDKIPRSARSTEPAWVTTVALPPETAPFDLQAAINAAGDGEPTVIELNNDILSLIHISLTAYSGFFSTKIRLTLIKVPPSFSAGNCY